MATISFNIPDADMPRIVDAFASEYNYTDDVGMTRSQFARHQIIEHVRRTVLAAEAKEAEEAARAAVRAAKTDVNNINIT